MNLLWQSLFLVLLIFQGPICNCSSIYDLFGNWCEQHGKTYSSEQERVYRFKVFEENYAYITEHNSKGNSSYTLGLNAYSDLTHHEFKKSFLGLSSSANEFIRLKHGDSSFGGVLSDVGDVDIPSSLDWREKGAVTNVKNQGSCGACWSFSATGAIEGINQITTGSLVSLSEQELIDCDRSYNDGCGGGLMDYAFKFVIKNGGIDTEKDYPFRERAGTCNKNKLQRHVVTIDGYTDIPQNDEDELLKAVATQPVSVGICGSARAFQSYSKGIFTGPCSTSLDHAVLIVGYGSENGLDYWIIKNSWGTSWGINGYMHMQRNTGNQEGICGINMLASYPTKSSPNPPTPPAPSPSKCSMFTSCGQGETCCCGWKFIGVCLSWKCCGLDSAVCCKDGRHCCPHDYPICDTSRNLCLKRMSNATIVQQPQKEAFTGKFGGLIHPF
ncbi:zingipain-2 [Lycium barbarum]|uniref:zingipain-2 n=1 Tax=Lycium barbarum TaxID=112863 RepID=UPI00293F581C|nr:zingipain-2 [Lycium barbarum]